MASIIYKGKQVNSYPFDGTITTSGLIASYDFSILGSYLGSGSSVFNTINPSMYTGALSNSPSFSSDFGGALNLVRASNQSILLGDVLNEVFTFINGTFSFEVWVKFNTLNNDTIYAFFTKNGDGNFSENQRQITFQAVNRTTQSYGGIRLDFVYFGDLNGTNIKGVRSNTATLTTGQVYHLVATFDNSITTNSGMDRVQFYVNSVNQSRTLWLNSGSHTAIANGTARLGVGGQYGTSAGPVNTIDGQVYAFSIYNKVLSSSEVTYNWNGKRNRFGL